MDWIKILTETWSVSSSTILKTLYIVFPILVLIECLKDIGILEKISVKSRGVTKLLHLPGEAAIGIVGGLLAGLILGSGIILQVRDEVELTKRQLNILFLFVGICHAIVEETLIFVTIGASGWVLIAGRFIMAVIFSFMYILITEYIGKSKRSRMEYEA